MTLFILLMVGGALSFCFGAKTFDKNVVAGYALLFASLGAFIGAANTVKSISLADPATTVMLEMPATTQPYVPEIPQPD
jgi:hypothetical protein